MTRTQQRGLVVAAGSVALVCAVALSVAGCKQSSGNNDDGGIDLAGIDLAGTLTCRQLNDCERVCKDGACVDACRAKAHPVALAKQIALEDCFDQECPREVDGGLGVCSLDGTGQFTAECTSCVNNTQVGASGACAPTDAPECHSCVDLANACKLDH